MPASQRKPRAPRATYHHGNLSQALLQAAAEVIAEQGVAELRMREVARRVGVSHGAHANHFRDRGDLLVALAIEGFERLTEQQRQVLLREHPSSAAALKAIGVAYVEFAAKNPAHFEVMFQRGLSRSPELQQAAARCFEQLIGAVAALPPAAPQPAGKRGTRELVALGSWALVHGLATLHVQGLLPGSGGPDILELTRQVLTAMTELGALEPGASEPAATPSRRSPRRPRG